MAVKSRKGKGSYATYKSESRLLKNQAKRRARHAKLHPNDVQSKESAKVGVSRKTPQKAGNFPAPNRDKFYRDASGKPVGAPAFAPEDRKTK
jgi:hypothetical protein